MSKALASAIVSCFLILISATVHAVPLVKGKPVIVQHLGKVEWPQDGPVSIPYLTQLGANDINDLHGEVTCDLIISTPGNYHMALKDLMKGRPAINHAGLQQRIKNALNVSVCWSTSPPVSMDQIRTTSLQVKNIKLDGLPALAMAPDAVMSDLVDKGMVDGTTRQRFLTNKGNVILIRAEKAGLVTSVCDLGGSTRVVTPNPDLEPGSFGNFSETIFNVANGNKLGCDARVLFDQIFSQDPGKFDLSVFRFPYNIDGVMSVFGRGSKPQGTGAKWVASSRIMHRDIPYALCNDEADAAVIFYHLALYVRETLARANCKLEIVPIGGTVVDPQPLPGNKIGKLFIAKVNGRFPNNVLRARDAIYDFMTTDPVWEKILADYGMTR